MKKTDSVPAMLTPKEAILNRNAAELLGRDAIKRLNAHGNMLAKRGVDLASDPTPGPSTENMLGYQMGTANVQGDDRGDLLRDADNTFYGGGQVPPPTPTPTPARMYQYGTYSVDDFDMVLPDTKRRATSRIRPGIINIQDDPTKPGYNPVSKSQYIGKNGAFLGPQYNPNTGRVNPLPVGAAGVQGFSQPQPFQNFGAPRPLTHTEMASDIAKRNLTATGSSLGTPQPQSAPLPSGVQPYISPEQAAAQGLQWGGRSWLPYVSPQQMTDQNLQYTGGQPSGSANAIPQSTIHFLPPGFTTAVGSTGAPNSTQNDINFLPPGFTAIQGRTNPSTKQLQEDQGYGSAYGY